MPRLRRSYRKPSSKSVSSVARKTVWNVLNKTREKKYYTNLATGNRDWSGTVYSPTSIPQGSTDTSRDGDRLYIKSFQFRGQVEVADTFNVCRLIIFQWKPASVPTVTDVLNTNWVGTQDAPHAPYSHDQRGNYRILYDKTVSMDTDDPIKLFKGIILNRGKMAKKLEGNIQYVAGGTTGRNKIYVLEISDSSAAAHPSFRLSTQLNYTDS